MRNIRRIRDEVSSSPSIVNTVEIVKGIECDFSTGGKITNVEKYKDVDIDTEYEGVKFLSLQVRLTDDKKVLLWNKEFPLPSQSYLDRIEKEGKRIIAWDTSIPGADFLMSLGYEFDKTCVVRHFFSPRDPEALFGFERLYDGILKTKSITKNKGLRGEVMIGDTKFIIEDMFPICNTSLDKAYKSVGMIQEWKSNTNIDKEHMSFFMLQDPEGFAEYCWGDIDLLELKRRIVEQINFICRHFGMEEFTLENMPMSFGSLCSRLFEKYLMVKYGDDFYKAVLLLSDTSNDRDWKELRTIKNKLKSGELTVKEANEKLRHRFVHGLGMGSIKNFSQISSNKLTGIYGAVVQGGRAVTEAPHDNLYENILKFALDVDQKSFYGTSQRRVNYPIGIPTIIQYGRDNKPMTVKEVVKKYGDGLVPGLWTMYIRTNKLLSFEQDLIPSKYDLSTDKIMRKILGDDWEDDYKDDDKHQVAHIGGRFLYTTRQIECGIITDCVYKTIKKVSTDRELKELMDCEVMTLVFYPKSKQLSVEEWTAHILKNDGGKTGVVDNRSRFWCAVPLDGYIGDLIDLRNELKAEFKRTGNMEFHLRQERIKLVINANYGCLASVWFPMGNTVVANNITAEGRVNTWWMSKALLTIQSITDGGICSWKRVAHFTEFPERLPGLHILANRTRFENHRSISIRPLTDEDVYERMSKPTKEDEAWIDNLVGQHIKKFCARYGFDYQFDIEVKYDHTSNVGCSYLPSCNYLIKDPVSGGEDIVKVRGVPKNEKNHPSCLVLYHIYDPNTYGIPEVYYEWRGLLGFKEFVKNSKAYPNMLPGYETTERYYHAMFRTGKLYETYDEFKRDESNQEKQKIRFKKKVDNGESCYIGLVKDMISGKMLPPGRGL